MDSIVHKSLGEFLREIRRKRGLPLRKVAAEIDLDPSTLGKIEKNSRRASEEQIRKLAGLFQVEEKEMLIMHYSDLIANSIVSLEFRDKILMAVTYKVNHTQIKEP